MLLQEYKKYLFRTFALGLVLGLSMGIPIGIVMVMIYSDTKNIDKIY